MGDWKEKEMGTIFATHLSEKWVAKKYSKSTLWFFYDLYAPWLSGLSLNNDPFPGVQGHWKKLGQKEKILENISDLI